MPRQKPLVWGSLRVLSLVLVLLGATLSQASEAAGATYPSMALTLSDSALRTFLRGSYLRAQTLPAVHWGSHSASLLVVFLDPNCPYSAQLWQRIRPYRDRLRINWVLVGPGHRESLGPAAGILASKDPATALAKNEDHFDFQREHGGLFPGIVGDPVTEQWVRNNTSYWASQFGVLPFLLFPGPEGIEGAFGVPTPAEMENIYRRVINAEKPR
ncbi:hypothetical protein ACSSZE_08100 [Acidithiobacillus caldus]